MSIVDRDRLARGVELLQEHVFVPLVSMAAELSAPSITQGQTQAGQGVFRLNFNVPYVGSRFFKNNPGGLFYIPFCLPPLQEDFDSVNPSVSAGTKTPVLTGVSFGFDQRGEPAHVADRWHGRPAGNMHPSDPITSNPSEGFTDYDRVGDVDIRLSIYEKRQHFFHAQQSGYTGAGPLLTRFAPTAESEVFTTTIGAAALSGAVERENPVSISGLHIPIDPKKTYAVGFNADGLFDPSGTRHLALVSVQIGLEFAMELVPRDNAALDPAHVQNIPSIHVGQMTPQVITITAPVAGGRITADQADGVSTGMEQIDRRFRHKLRGGYGDFSTTPMGEQMVDNAAYDIIAVPMFANMPLGEVLAAYSWFELAGNGTTYTDRAMIPITHPMTIHHVIATNNYTTATGWSSSPLEKSQPPVYNRFRHTVGVAVVNGEYADERDYTQVALGSYQPENDTSDLLIDFMDFRNLASHDSDPTLGTGYDGPGCWEQALFTIPLVRDMSAAGKGAGYYSRTMGRGVQGRPFFVGEAAAGGQHAIPRTNVGDNVTVGGIAPPTGGAEQYIEVRMQMEALTPVWSGGTFQSLSYKNADILSGYGGCWVYIIGKKHMRM